MRITMKRSLAVLMLAMAALVAPVSAAPLVRTVYVTVTDKDGAKVPDLTAADFAVKEGGKAVEIIKAVPATGRMHLALMLEERLAPDNAVRQALFDFIKQVQPSAEISLITVGLRNTTVIDYTQSVNALASALSQLTLSGQPASLLLEGLADVEHAFHQVRERVLGDGPKQSGGRRVEISSTNQASRALQQVGNDLLAQYLITYALPSGVKPDKRVNVSVKRKGITFRAPSAIPDQ